MPTPATSRLFRRSLSALALGGSLLLAACGGSSHSSAAAPVAPVVAAGPTIPATFYTVGGTLSGLAGGEQLTLQNNGADALTLMANGAFTFATPIAAASTYNVTVSTAPTGQTCTVTNGSGSNPTANVTSVGVSCVATTTAVSWVYIPDYGNDRVLGYRIDRTTGARTDLPGSPYPAGDNNRWIAMNPANTFVYTTNGDSHNVSAYTVNASTGELTPVAGSPYASGTTPASIEVSPDGRFAYVANSNGASISGFSINQTTGALTPIPGSPFAAGHIPTKMAITPNSRHLYVTNQNANTVSGLSIDATTGALTPLAGSPWATYQQGYGIGMHPSGNFLYVTNYQARLNVYRINPADGELTDLVPGGYGITATGWGWQSFTTNGAGTVGYIATSEGIRSVDIDTTTGALTEHSTHPSSNLTNFVTTNPTGTRLYSSDFIMITTHIADIDAGTGALSPIPGSPFSVGARPYNLVVIEP